MQTMLAAVALLLMSAGDGDAVRREKEQLRGTWAVVSAKAGTEADPKLQSMRIEFKEDFITIFLKDKIAAKGTYVIDPGKTPATMDISYERDGKALLIPAVFERKGDDLELCHPLSESRMRPAAVEANPNTVLLTLKRQGVPK